MKRPEGVSERVGNERHIVLCAIGCESGSRCRIPPGFALPLPRRNGFLPREGLGGLGRRLAGLAGTGTQAVEYPERLPGTGDSRCNRLC